MQPAPLVSVLMTAFNREKYIASAIESVLNSYYHNFELLIVDDCSIDDTVAIAQQYASKDSRIRLYKNEKNLGDYPNRNMAASYAQGKYLKYTDSDDILYPHALTVMVDAMEKYPEAGFGLSAVNHLTKPFPFLLSSNEAYMEHLYGLGHFNRSPGSSIIKRDAFEQVGGFSGERMIGDNDLWFKLAMYYPLVNYSHDMYWSRVHPGQESKSDYASQYSMLQKMVLDRYLQHRDCPISKEDKEQYYKYFKKNQTRNRVKNLISKLASRW